MGTCKKLSSNPDKCCSSDSSPPEDPEKYIDQQLVWTDAFAKKYGSYTPTKDSAEQPTVAPTVSGAPTTKVGGATEEKPSSEGSKPVGPDAPAISDKPDSTETGCEIPNPGPSE